MKKTPKISIIIPVYNVERYLPRCLDSVLAQTFADFELLLIDDGSPDRSPAICDQYAAKDPRIQVFHKPNGGVSSARNLGIDHAQGSFIAFIDADDYIEPNFLEEMLNAMNRYNADLVCCGLWAYQKEDGNYNSIRGTDEDKVFTRKEALIELLGPDDSIQTSPWNKLYKANIIRKNNLRFPEDLKYCEDKVFILRFIMHCSKVFFTSKILYHYMTIETSATFGNIKKGNGFNYKNLERIKADNICYDTIKALNDNKLLNAIKPGLFYSTKLIADRFICSYDGTDNQTLHLLRRKLSEYLPYYITNKRCVNVCGRRNTFRLMFCMYFPSLFLLLRKIKRKIKNIIKGL